MYAEKEKDVAGLGFENWKSLVFRCTVSLPIGSNFPFFPAHDLIQIFSALIVAIYSRLQLQDLTFERGCLCK